MRRGDLTSGLLFIGPWLVGLVVLVIFPFAASLYWSFTRFDLLRQPEFVGTENYQRLARELLAGEGFGRALLNTLYYAAVSVPLSIVLGVSLAVMLSWKVRGQDVFRALIYLPSVVPVVAAAILWMWLLDPQAGIVNHLLRPLLEPLGIGPPAWFKGTGELFVPAWLGGEGGAGSKDALVLMSLWGVGNFVLIYLAALQDIPRELYEAAELDGAGQLTQFRRITLPLLSPVIFFNLVMGLIQATQAFTQVYLVSEGRGAPAGSSLLLALHIFLAAFSNLEMGYASAIAWILFVVLLAATLLLFRTAGSWVHYRGPGA